MQRLNYIGSKYKLLEWIVENIKEQTDFADFNGIKFADLFAGTGVVSFYFRNLGAITISNDAELYSYILVRALTCCTFTDKCHRILDELGQNREEIIGYITKHYSPYDGNERKFFTIENAKKIDTMRNRIEEMHKDGLISEDEYIFLLASLIVSADAVSNVPAVYGCYLKNFKDKAKKPLQLRPIHLSKNEKIEGTFCYNADILSLCHDIDIVDIVYLDPPYNERQYSKNYFPLNMIAKNTEQLNDEPELKGITGIPVGCFISSFCKRGQAESAFKDLFDKLKTKTKWIFMSYNSESIVTKDRMIEIMSAYGKCSVVSQDYKRFKSFEYNKDKVIQEYLFCLEINNFKV